MANAIPTELRAKLRSLGAVTYDLMLPETKALAGILSDDEELLGVIWGRYTKEKTGLVSRGLLVATDARLILVNKKPMLFERDEITYWAISGADLNWVGIMGTLSLHARIGDIRMRTFNKKCAQTFMQAIENRVNQA